MPASLPTLPEYSFIASAASVTMVVQLATDGDKWGSQLTVTVTDAETAAEHLAWSANWNRQWRNMRIVSISGGEVWRLRKEQGSTVALTSSNGIRCLPGDVIGDQAVADAGKGQGSRWQAASGIASVAGTAMWLFEDNTGAGGIDDSGARSGDRTHLVVTCFTGVPLNIRVNAAAGTSVYTVQALPGEPPAEIMLSPDDRVSVIASDGATATAFEAKQVRK